MAEGENGGAGDRDQMLILLAPIGQRRVHGGGLRRIPIGNWSSGARIMRACLDRAGRRTWLRPLDTCCWIAGPASENSFRSAVNMGIAGEQRAVR